MPKYNHKDAVGLALQLVWEYPNWGDEHVSDMICTYKYTGDPQPCSGDQLMDLAVKAQRLKNAGKSYDEAEKELLKRK